MYFTCNNGIYLCALCYSMSIIYNIFACVNVICFYFTGFHPSVFLCPTPSSPIFRSVNIFLFLSITLYCPHWSAIFFTIWSILQLRCLSSSQWRCIMIVFLCVYHVHTFFVQFMSLCYKILLNYNNLIQHE